MRILGLLLALVLSSLFTASADARGHGGARGRAVVLHRHHNFFVFRSFAVPVPGNQIVPPLVSPIQPTLARSVLIVADGHGGFVARALFNSGGVFGFGNGGLFNSGGVFGFGTGSLFAAPVSANEIVPPLVSSIQPTLARSVFIVADGHGGFATHVVSNSGGIFRFANGSMIEANADAGSQVVVERHGGHESHFKMIVFGNEGGTRG
jgi:hypothetical protein